MAKTARTDFSAQLGSVIAAIERQSGVEIVVMLRQRSGRYLDSALLAGLLASLLTFCFFRFAPLHFDEDDVFIGTLVSFVGALALVVAIKPLWRLLIGRQRMTRNVEVLARALFQKGGVHHTLGKTGLLILVSWFENEVYIVPDRGVERALPPGEWMRQQHRLRRIFDASDPLTALIKELELLADIFSRFVPPARHDTNELPDLLEIDL